MFPTPEQLLLLQAALFLDHKALKAFEKWAQRVNFDKIDPASYKLLPLVSRNPALAMLQDKVFEKCRGIYRQVWVTNQLNWNKMLPTLQQLPGIDKIILLKGMAMILAYYKDFGLRILGDIDIFIERSKLSAAHAFLQANGWKPKMPSRFDINNQEHLNRWHALNFTHTQGLNLDLHWSFIEENIPLLDQAVLKGATPLFSNLYLPHATDLLLQICIHGTKHSPVPLIRWIADATTLLRHSEINWERLVELAKQAHLCRPLSLALCYLTEHFDVFIPKLPLKQLKTDPAIYLERLEYKCHKQKYQNLAAWFRYCLNKEYLTPLQQIIHIPNYLKATARLKSFSQLSLFLLYWPLKLFIKKYIKALFVFIFLFSFYSLFSEPIDKGVGVSSNPSPADHIGTGYVGKKLLEMFGESERETGLSLEGLWILDGNELLSGGKPGTDKGSINNLLQLELLFDTGKVSRWKGGLFAVEFLQLNGAQTNGNAGLVQGFEGLIQSNPLNRSEFYAWWYRQEWLEGKIITRIGKSTPNYDFNSVNRLFPMNDKRISPVASGVIYGTIFTQQSLSSFLPSYYNSAFGASIFYFPIKSFYVSLGGYDGNKARGIQTGIDSPRFNGYYLLISESGYSWPHAPLPGRIAVGVWKQTGKLTLDMKDSVISEQGVRGVYLYGSQRLWWKDKCRANSGLVTYLQLGLNSTKTLPVNKFLGWGLTAYGLVPGRLKDSFGLGLSLAGLNKNSEPRSNEWMLQSYYQCCLFGSFYLEPVLSYIPNPGADKDLPPTWAATIRALAYF